MGQVVAFSNSATRVGVLIADSVALNRQLMTLGLQRDKRLEVLDPGKASILETAKQSRPQVILLRERANETGGGVLGILKELRHSVPESRIVMLVDEQERQLVS
jgi:DNA-binding NarL/FixJ family response regulator